MVDTITDHSESVEIAFGQSDDTLHSAVGSITVERAIAQYEIEQSLPEGLAISEGDQLALLAGLPEDLPFNASNELVLAS